MAARPRLACLLAASLTACTASAPVAVDPATPLPQLAAKVSGMDQRPLRLRVEVQGGDTRRQRALEAWIFEAIAQSPWLDLDAGLAFPDELVVRGELGGAEPTLTSTWVRVDGGAGPVPLVGVRGFAATDLVDAVDRLALETRITLGEPPAVVSENRRSAGVLVSPDERAAAACGLAMAEIQELRLGRADLALRRALQFDPTCALAHSLAAGVKMDQGLADRAMEHATQVQVLAERASPQAWHRAMRVQLLASRRYSDLIALADELAIPRPRDPQVSFSRALGLCMLARYEEALPILVRLLARLPDSPGVLFCHGHALLATGRAEEALSRMPVIAKRVPPMPAGRLEAWVLLALGRHAELERHLDALAHMEAFRVRDGEIALIGMRAAHALLQGQDRLAGDLLLEQLDRLRSTPSVLLTHGETLIENAWVLARLDRAAECSRMLAMMRGETGLPEAVRGDGMVADTLCRVAAGQPVSPETLGYIENVGHRAWSKLIQAAQELARGQPARARQLLEMVAAVSDDPSVAYELAVCERKRGATAEADRLLAAIARELAVPRMDAPSRHPLVRPMLAIALREARRP